MVNIVGREQDELDVSVRMVAQQNSSQEEL